MPCWWLTNPHDEDHTQPPKLLSRSLATLRLELGQQRLATTSKILREREASSVPSRICGRQSLYTATRRFGVWLAARIRRPYSHRPPSVWPWFKRRASTSRSLWRQTDLVHQYLLFIRYCLILKKKILSYFRFQNKTETPRQDCVLSYVLSCVLSYFPSCKIRQNTRQNIRQNLQKIRQKIRQNIRQKIRQRLRQKHKIDQKHLFRALCLL